MFCYNLDKYQLGKKERVLQFEVMVRVRQMLTLADEGGRGVWLMLISLTECIKIAKTIKLYQTH